MLLVNKLQHYPHSLIPRLLWEGGKNMVPMFCKTLQTKHRECSPIYTSFGLPRLPEFVYTEVGHELSIVNEYLYSHDWMIKNSTVHWVNHFLSAIVPHHMYACVSIFSFAVMQESFSNMKIWLQEIDRYGDPDVYQLLLGNKSDLASSRTVKTTTGKVHT